MNPSPFFKGVIVTLIALALLAWALLQNAVYAADRKLARAPVVQPVAGSDVMKQIGWFTYEVKPGIIVLYCVPEGDTAVSCVVYAVTPKESGVVLITGIPATELRS